MAFCTKCGRKLEPTDNFCPMCGNPVPYNTNGRKFTGSDAESATNADQNNKASKMYESFGPLFGIGGKGFTFTDTSVLYGSETVPYSEISTVSMVTPPTPLTNGVAQMRLKNGRVITLAYENSQNDRFTTALKFVNEHIDMENNQKGYKFLFQAKTGTKIEVYDDYLIIYYVAAGATRVFSNLMSGSSAGTIILFSKIVDINFVEPANGYDGSIQISSVENSGLPIPIKQDDVESIKPIIDFITSQKKLNQKITESEPDTPWDPVKGKQRSFSFMGMSLEVSDVLDEYNTYRLNFRDYTIECLNTAKSEYYKRVNNLETFIEFFPRVYEDNLNKIIRKAVDALIAEEIWTVTYISFQSQHKANFHAARDVVNAMLESIQLTVDKNARTTSGMMSLIPNLRGGGFGFKGAMKGIAQATAFNVVRDGIEASAVKSASRVNAAQRNELYNRIDTDMLFQRVYNDYAGVFKLFIQTMEQNGHTIWKYDVTENTKMNSIFQNVKNPNFPKEKIPEILLKIMDVNPYKPELYKYMNDQFDNTDEISEIQKYFGYTDLTDYQILFI